MTQISVNITDEMMAQVSDEAQAKGLSPSQHIVFILDDYFTEKIKKELKRKQFLREFWETAEPDETFVEPPDFPPEPLDFDFDDFDWEEDGE